MPIFTGQGSSRGTYSLVVMSIIIHQPAERVGGTTAGMKPTFPYASDTSVLAAPIDDNTLRGWASPMASRPRTFVTQVDNTVRPT